MVNAGDGGKSAPGLQEPKAPVREPQYRKRRDPGVVTTCGYVATGAVPGLRPDGLGAPVENGCLANPGSRVPVTPARGV